MPTGRVLLSNRDLDLLLLLFLHRALTRKQIMLLMASFKSVSVTNARLRALFDHGFVKRRIIATSSYGAEALYTLGRGAINLVTAKTGLDRSEVVRVVEATAPLALEHALAATDARIHFSAVPAHITCEWLTEPEVRHAYTIESGAGTTKHIMKPDGAIILSNKQDRWLYPIEIDRGHVSNGQYQKLCASHALYRRLGLDIEVYGTPIRATLCVLHSGRRRLLNLAEAARREKCTMYFTLAESIEAYGPYARIWETATNIGNSICLMEER